MLWPTINTSIGNGGTTLVISPLIALMEDQVGKLKAQGYAVDRIHSGRPRAESRQACVDYLSGKTQFLFIAPERLRVAGFPEMLAKRPLSLIAIDEAHCISQWGHDFRPDYRTLGQYLPRFRPAPVIALTATATPVVQNDIVEQLGLAQTNRFVHGFRRDNLAIEVVEIAPSQRAELAGEMLREEKRRPAIVYTPTHPQADRKPRSRTCRPLSCRCISRWDRSCAPPASPRGIPKRPDPGDGGDNCLWHGNR
jgi:superfamily II DNA helicase RecQ